MAETKDKIISYRRAHWLTATPTSTTLERVLRDAHAKLASVPERSIERDGQRIISAKFDNSKTHGVFLHLTADTPGEAASMVPVAKAGAKEIAVGTASPPPNNEWMDGDAFLFVRANHVTLCTTGMRDGSITSFLQEFLRKSKIRHDADQFDLLKIADLDKVKIMRAQGVKEIEVRAAMYEATASYIRRKEQAQSVAGVVSRHFRALFGKPNDVNEDSLKVFVTIKTDERYTKSLSLGEKRIEEFAERLITEQEKDDDFVVVTKDGQRITPTEIYVRTSVKVERHGKSVNRDNAWVELEKFHDALRASGALET